MLQTFHDLVIFITIAISITFIINIIFVKDFRKLINKIKRVIFNPEQVNKITQIKKLVYEYLFID
jgi:hypothetical protein